MNMDAVMDHFIKIFNIYMIPPLCTLILSVTIAVISVVKGKLKPENILF